MDANDHDQIARQARQAQVLGLYLSVCLRVLSARVVLLATLALTFALFAWAMYLPDWNRIACATIFAVLIFLPACRIDSAVARERAVITPKGDIDG